MRAKNHPKIIVMSFVSSCWCRQPVTAAQALVVSLILISAACDDSERQREWFLSHQESLRTSPVPNG
jgi:hypothetical protein